MGFKVMKPFKYPRRLWALAGYAGDGKSTFAAQMTAPMLVIDADHRFDEVLSLVAGDVYQLEDPRDNVLAARITDELARAMPDEAHVATIVVDSLTEIITPLVMRAIHNNAAGTNTNKSAAFIEKAVSMRMLQSGITRWGTDVLWIYHLQDGRDNKGKPVTTTSIPETERMRMVRSPNARMRTVRDGSRLGIRVEWCRNGRDGFTLWDDVGYWRGMPEKLEEAMYPNGIQKQVSFSGPDEACAWAVERGAFADAAAARRAYDEVKAEHQPSSATEMWDLWTAKVIG